MMMTKKNLAASWLLTCRLLTCGALACLLAAPALAQEAPAPRKMPRVPVSREVLDHHDAAPSARQVTGLPTVMDGEKLRIGDTDMRLFGIVPPQLAASFGPQARAALDSMSGGQNVTCNIRDRDRDGRLLAICHTANGNDMALEMLKRGLAVTARGTLANNDLAPAYLAAEQAAQNQKIGLWSITMPAAAKAEAPAKPAEATPAPQIATPASTPVAAAKEDKPAPKAEAPSSPIVADALTPEAQSRIDDVRWAAANDTGFFERYQILIAGVLMLGTALCITLAYWSQKRRDKSDETRAIAAALRGELMAGRSICLGRIKSIGSEEEDRAANWPRLRSTLYAAYVGRLGLLGAELARLISSIYGQASDYTALYTANGANAATPKKLALENLVKHIDEVLPRLAMIEQTGSLAGFYAARARYVAQQQTQAVVAPTPASLPAAPRPVAIAAPTPTPVASTPATPTATPAPATPPAPKMETAIILPPQPAAPTVAYTAPNANGLAASVVVQAAHAPQMLWEAVRTFIQSHRNAIADQPQTYDPSISEYAAMIEADMARYQYGETLETLDITPNQPPAATKPQRVKSGT